MSVLTTSEQLITPIEGEGITLSSGAAPWANPAAWTEVFETIESTHIAGVALLEVGAGITWANLQMEVAIGVGPEGLEEEIGYFGLYSPNSGVGGPTQGPEPNTPIGPIAGGTRVSARLRANQVHDAPFAFKYYENYVGDTANIADVTLGMLPASADMVAITPNGAAELPSDWFVLSEALEVDMDVVALVMDTPEGDLDLRWELGTGLEGAETHVETFASASRSANVARSWFAERAGYLPLLAGERVVIRLRTSDAASETHHAALMVFRHEAETGEGTIGPLLWLTISFRPPVV